MKTMKSEESMDIYAVSVLLWSESIYTHTLHWHSANSHDEAIALAIKGAKEMKPGMEVVGVLCGNTVTGESKTLSFDVVGIKRVE